MFGAADWRRSINAQYKVFGNRLFTLCKLLAQSFVYRSGTRFLSFGARCLLCVARDETEVGTQVESVECFSLMWRLLLE